jgi:hypothetical protein
VQLVMLEDFGVLTLAYARGYDEGIEGFGFENFAIISNSRILRG